MRRSGGGPPARGAVLPVREGGARREQPPAPGLRKWVRRPRARMRWRRYVLIVVAMYCVWVGRSDAAVYLHLHAEMRTLQAQAAVLRGRRAVLLHETAYAETNAYVAAAARQEFGLVSPDEVPLAPLSNGAGTGGPGGTGAPAPSPGKG